MFLIQVVGIGELYRDIPKKLEEMDTLQRQWLSAKSPRPGPEIHGKLYSSIGMLALYFKRNIGDYRYGWVTDILNAANENKTEYSPNQIRNYLRHLKKVAPNRGYDFGLIEIEKLCKREVVKI